jgi:ribosomal protein L11 methyltransferase
VRNIAINHAEDIVRVERGSIDADQHRNLFDVACINILAEVICDLAAAVAEALRPGGIVIASGILDFKADSVIDALHDVGIETVEKKQEEDWVTLVGMKTELTTST